MTTRMRITLSLSLLACAAMLTGCDDNGVTASPEAEMILSATPETVIIDTAAGETSGESTITVQVLEGNFAANGVSVFFSTTGGFLHTTCIAGACEVTGDSCTESSTCTLATTQAVETSPTGVASVLLTLRRSDAELVTVTATSGTNSATVEVGKMVGVSSLPTAVLEMTPPSTGLEKVDVVFDGSESSAPDGEITCYLFDILPSSDPREIARPLDGIHIQAYDSPQTLDIVLSVSDDPTASDVCGRLTPADPRFRDSVALIYQIEPCPAPTAEISPATPTVTLSGTSPRATATLSGGGSDPGSHPAAAITSYAWDCGNDTQAQGVTGSCTYTAAGDYTAELTIRTNCGRSATDTVVVKVNPAP